MAEQQMNPFSVEIAKLGEIQQAILEQIQADQSLFNMGRQVMDNLNVTYLLVANLGQYMIHKDEAVEQEIEAGNVVTFPGAKDAPEA